MKDYLCILFSSLTLSLGAISIAGQTQDFDRFGGCTSIKGNKTGHWHMEEINGRHWFVTPEGNAFYVMGVNHFYHVEPENKEQVLTNLAEWGFNTAGYGAPNWTQNDMPFFEHVSLHDAIHWVPANRFEFVDVFSENFSERVDRTIRLRCESVKDNPYKIGYSMTDTPRYDLDINRHRRGSDWVSSLRSLDADAAGKRRYVQFLKERYQDDFHKFKTGYRLEDVGSFDDLYVYDFSGLELTRHAIRADDEAFLAKIAERIYQLTRDAFDRYDPDALVLSEKFKMHDHPKEI